MGLVDDFFVAVGEKSGEARLLLDTCAGAHDIVMENSIIWSCGNLKTRLSISSVRKARVAYTDGSNMRIRKNPGFDKKIVDSVPEGTEITISGGTKCIDNVTWWKISGGRNYKEGWMAEYNNEIYWLEPMPSLTPPTTKSACGSINTPESKNAIIIDAPPSFVQELANLDVSYVFYAHKNIGISKFNDIHGMTIFSLRKTWLNPMNRLTFL